MGVGYVGWDADLQFSEMKMLSLLSSAQLCAKGYDIPPDMVGTNPDHPIRINLFTIDDVLHIVPQGSKNRKDWEDNIRAWAVLDLARVAHGLTFIPEGFYYSSMSVFDEVRQTILAHPGGRFTLKGHSRGGSQASILAYLLAENGLLAESLDVIEPARPFYFRIPSVFQQKDEPIVFPASKIPVRGTWNGNDPVPHVPFGKQFILDIIGEDSPDPLDPLYCHHIEHVIEALEKMA